jgi:hypothetical protein
MEGMTTELISIRSTVRPQFFYCCRSDQLLRANLLTGEQSRHKTPAYKFRFDCGCSELPGGNLLITGGHPIVSEVVRIDTLRECAVSSQPPMHTSRWGHAAVYHSQYLYALGGWKDKYLSECERFCCVESRWEVLPALPVAYWRMSAVVLDDNLYALGGNAGKALDTVQKLSLDSLTWELMQLKLPQAASLFPCFKTDTQVYLMIKSTLYSFTPIEVKAVKTLAESIECISSYYSRGTLYYSGVWGNGIESLAVGELTRC